MIHITLPSAKTPRRLVFYLAMEEHLADHVGEEDLLFLWQVTPTVIFGRNQVMENEVNIPYCREHQIAMYRRKSGGGCVYADWGNLMISLITHRTEVPVVFPRYMQMLQQVLEDMGLPAVTTANNDVLIQGKKVSGNALFLKPSGCVVHGTMLYDLDIETMVHAITPSAEKVHKHGIASVRQRCVNLRDLGVPDMDTVKRHFLSQCTSERMLTSSELAAVEGIEQEYLDENFIHGA